MSHWSRRGHLESTSRYRQVNRGWLLGLASIREFTLRNIDGQGHFFMQPCRTWRKASRLANGQKSEPAFQRWSPDRTGRGWMRISCAALLSLEAKCIGENRSPSARAVVHDVEDIVLRSNDCSWVYCSVSLGLPSMSTVANCRKVGCSSSSSAQVPCSPK